MGKASREKWLNRAFRELADAHDHRGGPDFAHSAVERRARQMLQARRASNEAWAEYRRRKMWGLVNLALREHYEPVVSSLVYAGNPFLKLLAKQEMRAHG